MIAAPRSVREFFLFICASWTFSCCYENCLSGALDYADRGKVSAYSGLVGDTPAVGDTSRVNPTGPTASIGVYVCAEWDRWLHWSLQGHVTNRTGHGPVSDGLG